MNIDELSISAEARCICQRIGVKKLSELAVYLSKYGGFDELEDCSIAAKTELISQTVKHLINRAEEEIITKEAGTLFDKRVEIENYIATNFLKLSVRSRKRLDLFLDGQLDFDTIRMRFLSEGLPVIEGLGYKSKLEVANFLNDIVRKSNKLGFEGLNFIPPPERQPDTKNDTSHSTKTTDIDPDPESWMKHFNAVEVFCAKHDRLPGHTEEKSEEKEFFDWLIQQRNNSALSRSKVVLLRKLKSQYTFTEHSFSLEQLEALKMFVWQNGRLPDAGIENEKKLYDLYHRAKRNFEANELPEELKRCFEEILSLL